MYSKERMRIKSQFIVDLFIDSMIKIAKKMIRQMNVRRN